MELRMILSEAWGSKQGKGQGSSCISYVPHRLQLLLSPPQAQRYQFSQELKLDDTARGSQPGNEGGLSGFLPRWRAIPTRPLLVETTPVRPMTNGKPIVCPKSPKSFQTFLGDYLRKDSG